MDVNYLKEKHEKEMAEWEAERRKSKKVQQICFNCKSFEGYTVNFKCHNNKNRNIVIPYGIPTLKCDFWEEK